jgi:hypothetical protein
MYGKLGSTAAAGGIVALPVTGFNWLGVVVAGGVLVMAGVALLALVPRFRFRKK